jgi:hypothetical protein
MGEVVYWNHERNPEVYGLGVGILFFGRGRYIQGVGFNHSGSDSPQSSTPLQSFICPGLIPFL